MSSWIHRLTFSYQPLVKQMLKSQYLTWRQSTDLSTLLMRSFFQIATWWKIIQHWLTRFK